MKPTRALLIAAPFAAALLAAPFGEAAGQARSGSGMSRGGGHWSGSTGHWNGSYGAWRGGHHYHSYWSPWWGFYAAAPFAFGSYLYYSSWDPYWGYWGPRYYGYAYYPRYYYYDDDASPMSTPPDLGPPSEAQPAAPGSPAQGPLYLNYCASAKAYYPKVTSCPEGWQFQAPQYR